MTYPSLIPAFLCNTNAIISFNTSEISEEGAPIIIQTKTLKCNYQSKAKRIYTGSEVITQVIGTAYFPGDICSKLNEISDGTCKINNIDMKIVTGQKIRNPDNTVNYCILELK